MYGQVVVVIATYNERATIGEIIGRLPYHVLVVDDNSPDGTADVARTHGNAQVVVRKDERGIASAYKRGFQLAIGHKVQYVVQMDAGGTHDPALVTRLVEHARRTGAGLVIGARKFPRWGTRALLSKVAAFLMRLRGVPVTDATSGFRCWNAWLLSSVVDAITAEGFAFQLQTLYAAHQLGARIEQVAMPYRLTNSSFRWRMVWEALGVYLRL